MSKVKAIATQNRPARKTPLGLFSYLVGKSVVRLEENAYGQRITEFLIDQLDEAVDPGQVYITLKRLADRGFAKSDEAGNEGTSVKVYSLTAEGRAALVTTEKYIRVAAQIGDKPNAYQREKSLQRATLR